jgi:metal-responsive CopG/Arc/MetJ family transcriptional regulator
MKKSNIMSLSVEPEMQEHLKKVAKKKGESVSKLVRDLIQKYLPDDDGTEQVDTVILKIPRDLRQHPEELKKWMDVRIAGVVKALSS